MRTYPLTFRLIFLLTLMTSCAVLFMSSCGSRKKKEKPNTEAADTLATQNEDNLSWIDLLDSATMGGWRGFNADTLPTGWTVEPGSLTCSGKGGDIGGDIVYGNETFGNFELALEWKIGEGGNSGIFYHVVEGEQYKAPYENAPEYQVLDQIGFPEKVTPAQSVAADYGMHSADSSQLIVKPAGEWNTSKIVYTPEKVEHWLNGNKVVEFQPDSEDWKQRKANGKWKAYPDYGAAKAGLIGLQDHGSAVWYRNIKVKAL